jgi:hypothetical protein
LRRDGTSNVVLADAAQHPCSAGKHLASITTNLFVAPVFKHAVPTTDFLLIRCELDVTFLANSTRGICLWTLPSTGFASLSLCLAMPSLPPSRLHRRSNRFDDPAGFDRQISQLSLIVRLRRTKRGWYCREMPSVYTVGQLMPKVKPIHSLGNRLLRPRRSSEVSSLGVNFHLSAVLTGFASSRDIAIHPQTLFVPQLRRWRCRRPATKWSASTLRSARRL